jgi:hypothetical protein
MAVCRQSPTGKYTRRARLPRSQWRCFAGSNCEGKCEGNCSKCQWLGALRRARIGDMEGGHEGCVNDNTGGHHVHTIPHLGRAE